VPRLTEEFLAGERKALPAAIYSAEYEVTWLDETFGVWSTSLINTAFAQGHKHYGNNY
jgi:hypothetical protein